MFVHLGGEIVVRAIDIIAILDCSKMDSQQNIERLIADHETEKRMIWITEEEPKSFVITSTNMYASPISSITLNRRSASDDQERGEADEQYGTFV